MRSGHRQASSIMIGEAVKNFVISSTGKIRTVQDVREEYHKQYGIEINYQKAWRSRAYALDQIRGSSIDSYALLPLIRVVYNLNSSK